MSEAIDPAKIRCTAFNGTVCVASGDLPDVAGKVKAVLDANPAARVLIFNDFSGDLVDFDFRGTAAEVVRRAELMSEPPAPARGPGRPKLGVVAREVTLLPRHWDWLATQPGGASVALRRLVEEARRTSGGKDRVRRSQAAAYKFMVALAGDAPGFEEATRALFAGNLERFNALVEPWPPDVRNHARALATGAFPA
jgi:hypothetical protein